MKRRGLLVLSSSSLPFPMSCERQTRRYILSATSKSLVFFCSRPPFFYLRVRRCTIDRSAGGRELRTTEHTERDERATETMENEGEEQEKEKEREGREREKGETREREREEREKNRNRARDYPKQKRR